MNCAICHDAFEENDRVMFNKRETFIFKPADVSDTINAATATPEELAESRKDYTKTVMATVYAIMGKDPLPGDAISVRHVHCGIPHTAAIHTGAHPVTKHAIRFSRGIKRGGGHH